VDGATGRPGICVARRVVKVYNAGRGHVTAPRLRQVDNIVLGTVRSIRPAPISNVTVQ